MALKYILIYFCMYCILSASLETTAPTTQESVTASEAKSTSASQLEIKSQELTTSTTSVPDSVTLSQTKLAEAISNDTTPATLQNPALPASSPGVSLNATPESRPESNSGTPLQILHMTNKKFTLMQEDLEKILLRDDVKDSQIAVISIAGAFRGGKSFILDYFLRYLQASPEKREDGTWLGDKDQPLRGFSWRGGSERNTLGVLMWSEPYFVTLDDGKKVTILVVDTQGIFDNDSSVSDYSTIFAFSTLISSLILFNVRENIKEDDLNHLHLFSKFGALVNDDKGKIYQNIEFLVRDFPYPDETPYGPEGGQMLIDKRLEIKEDMSPELQEVRRNLLASYEKIGAFLMPHPGFGVFNPKYDGRWSVLTEDFKMYLKVLVDFLFSPSKIVPRKISGTIVTGKDLFEYIKSFMKVFEGDDIPTLQTIAKAINEVILRQASREAREYYQSHMEAEVGDSKPGISAAGVNEIHMKMKKEALEMFLTKKTMGDDKDVEPHIAKLQQDIEANLKEYLITNQVKLQNAIKSGNEAYHAYIKTVHKDKPLCLSPEDLKRIHNEAVNAGKIAFDSNRRQVNGVPDEERESFLKSLEENYHDLRSKNNLNNMAFVNDIILSYNSALENYLMIEKPISEEKLEKIHDEQHEKAKEDLKSKRNRVSSYDDDPFKTTLSERIFNSYMNYKLTNRNRNKQFRQKAYYYYMEKLSSFWDSDNSYNMCVPPSVLEDQHETYRRQAVKLLREDGYCSDEECQLLMMMINSHYDDIKELNKDANQRFENRAYRIYREVMDSKCSFSGWWIAGFGFPYIYNKSHRGDYHYEAKEKAENYFESHRTHYRWDSYYSSLYWRMNQAFREHYA